MFWGPTGTGKTHRAWAEAGDSCYIKTSSNKWWDGYRGETNVIIDEFDGQIGITHLLRWLDKYPCRVEIKGGSLPLRASKFWITSNKPIELWYDEKGATIEQIAALRRRCEIYLINTPYNP